MNQGNTSVYVSADNIAVDALVDNVTVEVSEAIHDSKFACDTCSGLVQKFEPYGIWQYAGDPVDGEIVDAFVCRRCIERGDVREPLLNQAERLEHEAAWYRRLADATWDLPTVAELERAARHAAEGLDELDRFSSNIQWPDEQSTKLTSPVH